MQQAPALVRLDENMIPALQQLAADIWWAHYPGLISDAQIRFMLAEMYSTVRLQEEMAAGVYYGGVQADAALCGYFSVRLDAEHPAQAWLDKLYLSPACHGRGWGQWMLQQAAACAWQLGADRLDLRVNRHNKRAIVAYERAGFVKVGEDCAEIGNGFVMDDFLFALCRPGLALSR